jgi:hypothetical protein
MSHTNQSTAVFLINDSTRAIIAIYEAGEKATKTMFKTFDQSIDVDDLIVVPTGTRHGMTVCKVIEVDVDVDFNSQTPVDWVISRVDTTEYDDVIRREKEALKAIRSAELNRERARLKDALLADVDGAAQRSITLLAAKGIDPTPTE